MNEKDFSFGGHLFSFSAVHISLGLYKVFAKMGAESLVSVLHNAQAPIRSRVGMEIEANAEWRIDHVRLGEQVRN